MSRVSSAVDTAEANTLVQMGLATYGDLIVSGSSGKLFRVIRVLKGNVNYIAEDENGKEWKVRVAGATAAPAGVVFAGAPAARSYADLVKETEERLTIGSVVEFKSGKFAGTGKYVVIRENGATVSVVKLGGDGGRYIRGCSPSHLTQVDAE